MRTDQPGAVDAKAVGGGSSDEKDQSHGIRSLARGLHILRCFDVENPVWALADLSRHMKLNRGTVHRFLKTLETEGFLAYEPHTRKYHVGFRVFQLGQVANSNSELVSLARPHMESLALVSSESVGLGVWVGDGVMFLDIALGPRPFRPRADVGQVSHDLRVAHCRTFLAFMPKDNREQVLAQARERLGSSTPIDFEQLSAELDRALIEGVVFDLEGAIPGVCVIAAPVRDAVGQVRASISIVVPRERFSPTERERHVALLAESASAVSHQLGYRKKSAERPTQT